MDRNIKIKILSKKDTDRIALHLHIAHELILKYENEYGEIAFNKDAKMYNEDVLNTAGAIERVYSNTKI